MSTRGRNIKRIVWIVAAIGVVYMVWAVWDHDAAIAWLQKAPPLPFFALMATLPMLGVPLTPFFVAAGAVFGTKVGVAGSMLALALNLSGCYVLGRTLRPRLTALMRRLGYELPVLRRGVKSHFHLALSVKLLPGVPGTIKSYSLAAGGVDFFPYFMTSMFITGTYGVLVIVLGESLFDHDRNKLVVAAVALLAVVVGMWLVRRRRGGRSSIAPT